jgi:hypothetical protein
MFAAEDRFIEVFAVSVAMPTVLAVHNLHRPRAVTGVTGRRKPARPDLVLRGALAFPRRAAPVLPELP